MTVLANGRPFVPYISSLDFWLLSERQSRAAGVGQLIADSCKSGPPAPRSSRLELGPPEAAFAVGHCEDEDALALMACARL